MSARVEGQSHLSDILPEDPQIPGWLDTHRGHRGWSV